MTDESSWPQPCPATLTEGGQRYTCARFAGHTGTTAAGSGPNYGHRWHLSKVRDVGERSTFPDAP